MDGRPSSKLERVPSYELERLPSYERVASSEKEIHPNLRVPET